MAKTFPEKRLLNFFKLVPVAAIHGCKKKQGWLLEFLFMKGEIMGCDVNACDNIDFKN